MNKLILIIILLVITSICSLLVHLPTVLNAKIINIKKLLALLVIILHDLNTIFIIFLNIVIIIFIITKKNYKLELIILNIFIICLILSFIFCKMCILTLLYNKLLERSQCYNYKVFTIGFIKDNISYKDIKCLPNALDWIRSSLIIILFCIIYNIIYIIK
jgi:hypothetical protein